MPSRPPSTSVIPKLAKTLAASGRREFVDQSDRVLASTRLVKFYEMEYSIERVACVEARDRLRSFIEREGLMLNFPVEVRFTAPDDIPLSTGTGREVRISPCTCSRRWSTSATSVVSRRSWTTTAAVRTGASCISRPPRRCTEVPAVGRVRCHQGPPRPRGQLHKRLRQPGVRTVAGASGAVSDRPTVSRPRRSTAPQVPSRQPHPRRSTTSRSTSRAAGHRGGSGPVRTRPMPSSRRR